ncbi:dinucleotide-utilizing enzyme [Microbacterium sulfonylureivorans]|uniref:dinucleotide-utilizing enzyme n=1 Tax=Microbacterium sulfonylureivorans TaxID=2486854 RepID=UPI000FD734D7|nr:dinucleotide-utilizing enzyme [Microbacterium sulfonylureivorans]
MSSRPALVRSIPFWGLVAASLGTAGYGALVLTEKLGTMTTTLTDGTATGVEVYVGQSQAVFGAVLVGAGVVGILLALTVASLATLRPSAPVEVVEPLDWDSATDDIEDGSVHGYERGLGYTAAVETVGRSDEDAEREASAATR